MKANKHPVADGGSPWLHKVGTMCGQLFGRGGGHLWKWDGQEYTLLEEGESVGLLRFWQSGDCVPHAPQLVVRVSWLFLVKVAFISAP